MRGPEGKIQDKLLKDLRSYGKYIVCTKVERTSDNATPDIYFTTSITGSVWVETKRELGEAEVLQEVRIRKLNRCGTKAFVCNSWERWQEIKSEIGLPPVSEFVLFIPTI
jgi:hypothetical protein